MKLTVLDSAGTAQSIITHGSEAVADYSGALSSSSAQTIAAASATRSGFFFQNLSVHNMWLNDLGIATASSGSILVAPGAIISAPYNYPLNTNALSLIGTSGDIFTLRQW
jgi:hypothetical protein